MRSKPKRIQSRRFEQKTQQPQEEEKPLFQKNPRFTTGRSLFLPSQSHLYENREQMQPTDVSILKTS